MATTIPISDSIPQDGATAPTFLGVVQGEIFKMIRQPVIWFAAIGAAGMAASPSFIVAFLERQFGTILYSDTYTQLYVDMNRSLSILRVFAGFFMIFVTARIIGLDFQQGTLRIILARGVDRMQLVLAKMLTAALAGGIVLVAGLAWAYLGTILFFRVAVGDLKFLDALTPSFWVDTRLYILTIVINMLATLMMTAFVTIWGRSLAFGVAAGFAFFPADNFLSSIMGGVIYPVTHNDLWLKLTTDLLGPILNVMPVQILGTSTHTVQTGKGTITAVSHAFTLGTKPYAPADTTHIIIVLLVWCAVFLIGALVLASRRDVTE